ncbi:MAG TPA: hypothetical protein VKB58_13700 [Terriglobales bacterium]|jgi:hypothetical protein|nr:hypothetical protein [Terriglobales bacterium]
MVRKFSACFVFALSVAVLPCPAQSSGQAALQSYFVGKQVTLQIDMPGTQQGLDLRLDRDDPMDWKQYSNRLKQFGPAIRTGDRATVTTIVVKKNLIEFQLDGGGFGTFWDDSDTTVTPYHVDKSSYEKQLERDINNTTDPQRRRDLQRELNHVRNQREREQRADDRAASIASQMKAQQVADKRLRGGSRFNLRWSGPIPQDQLAPQAVMKLLDAYVDFGDLQQQKAILKPAAQNTTAASNAPAKARDSSPITQLKRGMQIGEISEMMGLGRQLSQSTSEEGLKTQIFEYLPDDYRVEVTYVDGVVVRYSISSR